MRTLILLEPILTDVPSVNEFVATMAPVMKHYADGDMAAAIRATFCGLAGENWRDVVATAGPNAVDFAIRDAESYYRVEAPSLEAWTLDAHRAAAVVAPAEPSSTTADRQRRQCIAVYVQELR